MRGNLGSKVQPILNFSLFCHFVTGDLDDRQFKELLMIGRTEVERHTEIGGFFYQELKEPPIFLGSVRIASLCPSVNGKFNNKSINDTFKYAPKYG